MNILQEYYELLYVIFIIFVFGPPTLSGKIHHYRQKNAKKATLEIVFSCILSIFNNFEGSYLKNDGSKPISNCIKNSQIEIVTSSSTQCLVKTYIFDSKNCIIAKFYVLFHKNSSDFRLYLLVLICKKPTKHMVS